MTSKNADNRSAGPHERSVERAFMLKRGQQLFWLALLVRLLICVWAWDRVPPTADGSFYHVVAQRIVHGEGYTWLWPDGAVTFAAHYPVGYPALMAVPYWIFGPHPGAVMLLNALLGALAVRMAYEISWVLTTRVLDATAARKGSLFAGLLLALSPTLIGYTPALMTEGAVGALLILGAWVAGRMNGELGVCLTPHSRRYWLLTLILLVGCATLLRPQSILLAPVLGWLAAEKGVRNRLVCALFVSLGALAVVAPWTARNCEKMERCVFVSANGGWNLLIGTFPEGGGAWVALEGERVPDECRDVFAEAEKDRCFQHAATTRIRQDFWNWLSLGPAKLRATFDHTAAAAEHLSAAGALGDTGRRFLMVIEYISQRLMVACSLIGAWRISEELRTREVPRWAPRLLLLGGFAGLVGAGAWIAWATMVALLAVNIRSFTRVGAGYALGSVAITLIVHGVFFGAGRYSIPLLFAVAPLVAVGSAWLWKSRSLIRR